MAQNYCRFKATEPGHNSAPSCGFSDWPLHVPNLTAVPAGYSVCGTNFSYNPPPAKVTPHDQLVIDHVKRFSENSKKVSILHNNNGSSLAPNRPTITHQNVVNAVVRNPFRYGSSRSTDKEKRGVDQFRPDTSKYLCMHPPPPSPINERHVKCANAFPAHLRPGAQDAPCDFQPPYSMYQ